ncbi:unnamed protein product [Camellia sinensis]
MFSFGSAAVIYSKENLLFLAVIPSDLNRDEWVEALGSYLKHLNSCSRQGVCSGSHNLKYMGIDALGRLIKTSPEIAIDCLELPSQASQ